MYRTKSDGKRENLMVVRGAYMLDTPPVTRTFIMQRTRDQLEQIERENRIQHIRIQRMLTEAKDADNYLHNVYKHRLGNLVFEFRLHRTAVHLYGVTRLY